MFRFSLAKLFLAVAILPPILAWTGPLAIDSLWPHTTEDSLKPAPQIPGGMPSGVKGVHVLPLKPAATSTEIIPELETCASTQIRTPASSPQLRVLSH